MGVFMNLQAINAIAIGGFAYTPGVAEAAPVTLDVYTRDGGYEGFVNTPLAWTFRGRVQASSQGNGQTVLTTAMLPAPIAVAAGQTMGVYLVGTTGGIRSSFSNVLSAYGNADLSVAGGVGEGGPFTGEPVSYYTFTGRVYYQLGCYANCDGSTVAPVLNVADFACFLQKFAGGNLYANCDGSTTAPVLNIADFACFLQKFAAGCP